MIIFYSLGLVYQENTIFQDYTVVMKYVNISCTCAAQVILAFIFSIMSEPVADFEGAYDGATYTQKMLDDITAYLDDYAEYSADVMKQIAPSFDKMFEHARHSELVDSREVDLHFFYQRVMREGTAQAYADLKNELEHRQFVDKLFNDEMFSHTRNSEAPVQNYDCLKMMVEGTEDMCGKFSAYSLKHANKLAGICDTKTAEEIADIYVKIGQYCSAF